MNFGNWKIKTSFEYPPIPDRSMDWMAWVDGQEEHSAWYGHGQTELEALLDLHQHLVEDGEIAQLKWVEEWEAPLNKARDEVFILRARIAQLEAERQWRPIAEAPKDGKPCKLPEVTA